MFDSDKPRSNLPILALGAVVLLGVAGLIFVPGAGYKLATLLGGGNPMASNLAETHEDTPYAASPLEVWLALDARRAPGDAAPLLSWADDLAGELGSWLLADTGASDLQEAETAMWTKNGADRFLTQIARELQQRQVFAHPEGRLLDVPAEDDPRQVHPDELVVLYAHVLHRLDLAFHIRRSAVHLYIQLDGPNGRATQVEPTCFRAIRGTQQTASCVGVKHTFSTGYFEGGAGGVRNPDPLPAGAYTPVEATELEGVLASRLLLRPGGDALREVLGSTTSGVQARFESALASALNAIDAKNIEDAATAHEELVELRRAHGVDAWPRPDERYVEAWLGFNREPTSRRTANVALDVVLAHYEPDGPVERTHDDIHLRAMWLVLRNRPIVPDSWNSQLVPLFNHHRDEPEVFAVLCSYGRQALATTTSKLAELMPDCEP